MWLQCREIWCFSYLYLNFKKDEEYLKIALQGAEFVEKYGMDEQGNWYFSLTREGKPLV